MTDASENTTPPSDEVGAEAWGRDGFRAGVGLDAARAYSDTPRIQAAWRRGWMAEHADAMRARGRGADERFWMEEAKHRGF